MERTLDTTNMDLANAAGVEHEGDPGRWVCICKAWNRSEGWMKSTKVLEVPGAGCFLQVTTKEKDAVAEAVCWAPGVRLSGDGGILEAGFEDEGYDPEYMELVLCGFSVNISQVADEIEFQSFYRGASVFAHKMLRDELLDNDGPILQMLDPFLMGTQRQLEEYHDVRVSRAALEPYVHDAAIAMFARVCEG